MAYGLRLRIEYKDINEVLTRINIYQDGYSGAADVRYAHAAFTVEWGDQGGNGLPLIYGSAATLFFDAEYDYEFLYLFSADAKKHLVEILKGGVLFWTGFIEPDSWIEPLIATPYPVQCTAYDMLGFLKDVAFVPNGRKSIDTILNEILALTGLTLPVNTNIDWFEFASGPGSYLDHSIDTIVFEEMSCYEVLEQLFQTCKFLQRGGEWHIISNNAIADTGPTASGWTEGQPEIQILPAIKQQTVVQDFGYNENLLVNGSFDEYNAELAKFETWDNIAVTPLQMILNNDGDKYVYIPGKQMPDSFANEGYGLQTNGITKEMAVIESASILNIAMKYALVGVKSYNPLAPSSSLMFIRITVVGEAATYYLRRVPYVPKDVEWEWVNSNDKISQGDDRICLLSHTEKSYYSGYYNTFDVLPGKTLSEIPDNFEDFRASVAGIPISGLLVITLFVPFSNRTVIKGSCFTGITLELLDENNTEYPAEKTHVVVNSVRNNYVPDDLNLVVGDYPNIINNKIIYKGGFRRADDTPSTLWGLVGDALAYTYAEFIGRMIAASQSYPRQNYKVRLADLVPMVHLIIDDANNPGKKFVETGIVYDDRYQACEGVFSEIDTMNLYSLAVEGTTMYSLKKKPEIISATPNPVNIEERVTLIDKLGAKVSAPGFMYDNDFEIKRLTEEKDDGKTRLQLKNRGVSPYALDHDAGTLQFSIKDGLVSASGNTLQIEAGLLISHNFNALDRDDIETLKAL